MTVLFCSAVSDSHFSLAVAYIYNAAEDTVEDPVSEKKKALAHYNKARESIVKWIEVHQGATSLQDPHQVKSEATAQTSSSSGDSKQDASAELEAMRADKAELADMLQETVDALKIEIEEVIIVLNRNLIIFSIQRCISYLLFR